jgi:hypothetical protein
MKGQTIASSFWAGMRDVCRKTRNSMDRTAQYTGPAGEWAGFVGGFVAGVAVDGFWWVHAPDAHAQFSCLGAGIAAVATAEDSFPVMLLGIGLGFFAPVACGSAAARPVGGWAGDRLGRAAASPLFLYHAARQLLGRPSPS